jgi:outer membrane protease
MPPMCARCRGAFVTTIKKIPGTTSALAAALAASLSFSAPAKASDWTYRAFEPPATYTGEFGTRFWYGRGKTGKDLFDTTGSLLVSRLTYADLNLYTLEGFGRFDFAGGWFLKGYAGGGMFRNGSLKDEDFEPVTVPYSATLSDIGNSSLVFASLNLGFKLLRGPDFHVGAFVGYHYMKDSISAYGCNQIATNGPICGTFSIPDWVKVISQDNHWHSLRLGIDASVEIGNRLKLSIDAAWLPYVRMDGADSHWLRIGTSPGDFTGPVPEDGTGWGYQLEGFVSYRVTDWVSVGVGARYWHMETKGHTHFEGNVVGFAANPQVLTWKNDIFGVYLQSSIKLGPYPLISRN